jgi:uncharacterized protein
MEIVGYIAALLIGLSLGLIGGGGSILTVPVFVYLFRVSPAVATSYSLFVVGSTSLIGSFGNYRKGLIDIRTALYFGLPSIVTIVFTRKFILPLIPETIPLGNYKISFDFVTMMLFATLILAASRYMLKGKFSIKEKWRYENRMGILMLSGVGIGIVTGFLGAGGGFLLIPALSFIRIPIRKAIATSLIIVAFNGLTGFIANPVIYDINWSLLVCFSLIAMIGVFVGTLLNRKIHVDYLKKAFGWFVLLIGVYIVSYEIMLQFF